MVEWLNVTLWIVQGLLALAFLMAGTTKALRYEKARQQMAWVRDVPKPMVRFIGTVETLGAFGLVLPLLTGILEPLTALAAIGLATVMVLASGFHARRRELQGVLVNAILFALAAFVAIGRWELLTAATGA